MRDRIEASEGGSSEQCVITTAEGDNVEDQVFASEVVLRTEDYFQCFLARAAGFYTRYYSFEGGFGGLDA